mmetsp:Transcript_24203/g.55658  ORF Transcript_24203/g.55658 Transcript_24203/m.55658 type:complete len:187 (-) Transcript_24203:27-587(-)
MGFLDQASWQSRQFENYWESMLRDCGATDAMYEIYGKGDTRSGTFLKPLIQGIPGQLQTIRNVVLGQNNGNAPAVLSFFDTNAAMYYGYYGPCLGHVRSSAPTPASLRENYGRMAAASIRPEVEMTVPPIGPGGQANPPRRWRQRDMERGLTPPRVVQVIQFPKDPLVDTQHKDRMPPVDAAHGFF